jgi:glycosyltransferase involved in cell wall biosynthesis
MINTPFVSPFPQAFPQVMTINNPKKDKGNVYLNLLADHGGCGFYRIIFPEIQINMSNLGQSTSLCKMILNKDFFHDVKVVKLQRQAASHQKEYVRWLKSIQSEMQFKLIYEVDDVVFHEEIPDYNVYKEAFADNETRQNCIDMINMVDEVTVPCKYMRDLYIEKTGKKEISAVPNFHPEWWIGNHYDLHKKIALYEKNKKKPRILYAGSGAHFDVKNLAGFDDFSHVMKFIIDNVDKYQFIFIGAYPPALKPFVDAGKIEFHPWQNLMNYPKFLDSLNAQLFLAPLHDNRFNRSKSDIKYVEAAALGVPCMCQDMVTYQDVPDFLKFNNSDDLAEKVENLLNWKNSKKYFKLLPELRKIGESRFLERPENIGAFMESLNTEYGSVMRKYMLPWN